MDEINRRFDKLFSSGDQEYFGLLAVKLEARSRHVVVLDGDEFVMRHWEKVLVQSIPCNEPGLAQALLYRLIYCYLYLEPHKRPPQHMRAFAHVLKGPDQQWYIELGFPRGPDGTAVAMWPDGLHELTDLVQWLTVRTPPR